MSPDETEIQRDIEARAERRRIAQAGIDLRAGMDTETVRGLQLINGGMAAGLVTMLPAIIRDQAFRDLGKFMIVGILFAAIGLFASLVHNRLRRKCSLETDSIGKHHQAPIAKWLSRFQTVENEPCVCTQSIMAMWASMILFLLGAASVGYGFLTVPPAAAAQIAVPAKIAQAAEAAGGPTIQLSTDPRVAFDLQERCGRDARDWFQHFYGDGQSHGKDFSSSNYTNHYNAKLNRCFAVVSSFSTLRDEKTKQTKSSDDRHLVDINENKDVGSYFKFSDMSGPMQCSVGENRCASQGEWEATVASYMDR
jgi:hypothetical protein